MDTLDAPRAPDADTIDARERSYVGQVLGERYVLGAELGAGGMGVVHEARHLVLGTRLAVKVLRAAAVAHAPDATERFAREARAASAIGHPHIVDVLDMGTLPGGTAYYVMEHLSGRDLGAELRASEHLAPGRAARIGAQIASALAAAHARGVIHRDLKPENVFLTARRTPSGALDPDFVKVIDFGIAKLTDAPDDTAQDLEEGSAPAARALPAPGEPPPGARGRTTALGVILGTPVYMSPEQCAGRALDARSDIYSLGVVLYEMLTGAPPFDGDEPLDVMRRHELDAPPALEARGFEGPAALAALVARCLAKRPSDRPASMAELEAALRTFVPEPVFGAPRFSVGARSEVRSHAGEPGVTAPAPPPARRSSPLPGLVAASIVAVVAVVTVTVIALSWRAARAAPAAPAAHPSTTASVPAERSSASAPAAAPPSMEPPSAAPAPPVPAEPPVARRGPRPTRSSAPSPARPPVAPAPLEEPSSSPTRRTAPTDLVADPWRE